MVLTVAGPASAVDVTTDGEYLFQYQSGSEGFRGRNTDYAMQRLRLGLTFSASEELAGYFQLQVGEWHWGEEDYAGTNGRVSMRQAYVDWTLPGTEVKVRMGRHAFDLPAYASTSPMIADLVADGVVVSVPFGGNMDVTAFWTRMARGTHRGEVSDVSAPKYDLFGVAGTASLESVTVSPWVLYGAKGDGTDAGGGRFQPSILTDQGNLSGSGRADIVVMGAGMEWKPSDPVTLALDGAWGRASYGASADQEGWYAVGRASYAMSFGEPSLLAWYASGDGSGRAMHSGQIPIIYGDFDGTSTYFDGAQGIVGGHRCSFGGTWGVSAQVNGVSFLEGLTHDVSVSYFAGTNSRHNGSYGEGYDYLTRGDSAVELDLLSPYEIYRNLSAMLEMAYIIEDFDTKAAHGRSGSFDDDWRTALVVRYAF